MAKCIVCKKEFQAKRSDAKFCSPNCRQRSVRGVVKSEEPVEQHKKPKPEVVEPKVDERPEAPKIAHVNAVTSLSKQALELRFKKLGF